MAKLDLSTFPALPHFTFEEVEELFKYGLTLPDEIYNAILQKDRRELIGDLEKILVYATDHHEAFSNKNVPEENTFFVWHTFLLLKDLKAEESLPAVLKFVKQDEDIVSFYLGSLISDYAWELYFTLGINQLRSLVDVFKEIVDDLMVRSEMLKALQQVALRYPERRDEIEAYLHELLLFVKTRSTEEDAYIDEATENLLEVIGEGQFINLYPEVKKAIEENSLPLVFVLKWEEFEEKYILQKYNQAELADFQTREEFTKDILLANDELDAGDYDYEEDEDLDHDEDTWEEPADDEHDDESDEEKGRNYIDNTNVPYVKTEPNVGRNDPCPCGSGKKFKQCHGKS